MTHKEMDEKIVEILRLGNEPHDLYAAELIVRLQKENKLLQEKIKRMEETKK